MPFWAKRAKILRPIKQTKKPENFPEIYENKNGKTFFHTTKSLSASVTKRIKLLFTFSVDKIAWVIFLTGINSPTTSV
jgi:hypothetical protein